MKENNTVLLISAALLFSAALCGRAFPAGNKDSGDVEGVTLHLKHGGRIEGRLVAKTGRDYTVEWKGENYVIEASRVKRVEYASQKDVVWKYSNDVVVKRTNGVILDGEITAVDDKSVTLSYKEGGGNLEIAIERKYIDHLIFAPVCNKESQDIEDALKNRFSKLKFYKEGNYTIATDSHYLWVKRYKKTIEQLYTEIYFKFFNLFKGRKQKWENFVVIFDDPWSYAEYAMTDGIPFWLVRGYFSPTEKALYLYNGFGKKIEEWVFEVIIGKFGGSFDEFVAAVKKRYGEVTGEGSRYDIFIDGYMKKYKDRYWNAYEFYKRTLTEDTLSTLRHEFTHEIFHDWGLQSIVLSKPETGKEEIEKKKKEYLEAKDWNKKKVLLEELMHLNEAGDKDIKMDASQSWLAEGIATYCETDPIGSTDERWLYLYQEMAKADGVSPIEFLTNFKMGSFPGLCAKGMLNSYAESWALTSFLMETYPLQFMAYQKKMAESKPKTGDDELEWLLEGTGKNLEGLEKEFKGYMKKYPEIEDPRIKEYIDYLNIWREGQ